MNNEELKKEFEAEWKRFFADWYEEGEDENANMFMEQAWKMSQKAREEERTLSEKEYTESFRGCKRLLKKWLKNYPEDIFTRTGQDVGVQFITKIREALDLVED